MTFEAIFGEIRRMFEQMDRKPEDAHELLDRIHLELNQLKASGMPLPDDLAELEKTLEVEFARRRRTPPKSNTR